jgi:nicotinamidase-related amidase
VNEPFAPQCYRSSVCPQAVSTLVHVAVPAIARGAAKMLWSIPEISTAALALFIAALAGVASGCQPAREVAAKAEGATDASALQLVARSQSNRTNDPERWAVLERFVEWKADETAIVITDMWDRHWCEGAAQRVAAMAPRIDAVVKAAREKGVSIIHAPSSVTDFYADHPARTRMLRAPSAVPPARIEDWYQRDERREAPLPIDDSDGGCDTCPAGGCDNVGERVWTRQIDTIEIAAGDGISDSGAEIYNYFRQKGIHNVILMGVHTNMCVLGRSFGLRAQRAMGLNAVLARDLTDAIYNPAMPPFVSHEEGTDLVVDHIEKYVAPTVSSAELVLPRPTIH